MIIISNCKLRLILFRAKTAFLEYCVKSETTRSHLINQR